MTASDVAVPKRGRPRKAVTVSAVAQSPAVPQLLNRQALGDLLRCSRQKIYDLEEGDSDFPAPLYVGTTPLWLAPEIAAYLQRKADARPSAVRARAAEAEPA